MSLKVLTVVEDTQKLSIISLLITFPHNFQTFVPTMDQLEIPGLIYGTPLARGWANFATPCLRLPSESNLLPLKNFLMDPDRWKSEGARSALYGECSKISKQYPCNFSRARQDRYGQALPFSSWISYDFL